MRLIELDDKGQPVKAEAAPENDELKTATAEVAQATEQLKQLEQQLKQVEANAPEPLPKAIAVDEAETVGDTNICVRGEHTNLGRVAPRGVLQVALNGPPPKFSETTSGRLELANWIASPQHPLTARVYVNRLWYHLIGQGIVASVDNFGELGQRPTHPELLDDLAAHFMENGWSTKQTIRRIVLSRTYRMSSRHDENALAIDPENKLLWRAHRRRLPAESIRDAMLAISGQLELAPGGSPVEGLGVLVTQNTSERQKFERKASQYRSAYLPIIRSEIPAILGVFDFADPDLVTGRRAVTNVPAQALLLLNSPFVMDQAENAASRVQASAGVSFSDDENEVRTLVTKVYETVLSRPPTAIEFAQAVEFLSAASGTQVQVAEGATDRPTPLAQLIHTLFASTEFRMLD